MADENKKDDPGKTSAGDSANTGQRSGGGTGAMGWIRPAAFLSVVALQAWRQIRQAQRSPSGENQRRARSSSPTASPQATKPRASQDKPRGRQAAPARPAETRQEGSASRRPLQGIYTRSWGGEAKVRFALPSVAPIGQLLSPNLETYITPTVTEYFSFAHDGQFACGQYSQSFNPSDEDSEQIYFRGTYRIDHDQVRMLLPDNQQLVGVLRNSAHVLDSRYPLAGHTGLCTPASPAAAVPLGAPHDGLAGGPSAGGEPRAPRCRHGRWDTRDRWPRQTGCE